MTRIKRGGRELVVDDTVVAEYLKQGYSVIDDKGNELSRAQATTFSQLKAEYDVQKQRLNAMGKELDAAKAKIADLEAQLAAKDAPKSVESAPANNIPAQTPAISAGNTRKPVPPASTNKSSSGAKPAQKAK